MMLRHAGTSAALLLSAVLATGAASAQSLGSACTGAGGCDSGLSCATTDSGIFDGQGPAKGYCTVECTSDPGICNSFGSGTVCLSFENNKAYCFQGCSFGPTSLGAFSPDKCHGREELACVPLFDEQAGTQCTAHAQCTASAGDALGAACLGGQCYDVFGACLPSCNIDEDCGAGSYCDPGTGRCSSSASTGKSLGEACNSQADPDECRGACTGVEDDGKVIHVCGERCTVGSSTACGWAGPGSGPAPGACLFTSSAVRV
jgi:hypothetical protein